MTFPVAHPAARRPHVVIVGGGFAGLHAARALRDSPVKVTLVDRTNHHLFQPLLYQVATASLSPGDITAPIRWILRRQQNAFVILGEVTAIDVESRTIVLDSTRRTLTYDFLVLAPGGRHSYFAHPEWETLAPGLKSVEDAAEMRRRFLLSFERAELCDDDVERAAYQTIVIVGAGPRGRYPRHRAQGAPARFPED
jgi:NADH dehydrogenase